ERRRGEMRMGTGAGIAPHVRHRLDFLAGEEIQEALERLGRMADGPDGEAHSRLQSQRFIGCSPARVASRVGAARKRAEVTSMVARKLTAVQCTSPNRSGTERRKLETLWLRAPWPGARWLERIGRAGAHLARGAACGAPLDPQSREGRFTREVPSRFQSHPVLGAQWTA